MKKAATILGMFIFATQAQASLWNCQTTLTVRTIVPKVPPSKVQQSFEIEFFDDGTVLEDNHISSFPIDGVYYLKGRKAFIYPNRDTVAAGIYEAIPGISNLMILSNFQIFKFKGRPDTATQARVTGHVDEQFINENGVFVRAVGNGKGNCSRLD